MMGLGERACRGQVAVLILTVVVMLPISTDARGADQTAPAVDFEHDVRPILVKYCTGCHGVRKQEGGLRLDSLAGALEGGDSGPVLSSPRLEDNLLLGRIESVDPALRMPLKAAPLGQAETAILKSWIEQGAPWPEAGDEGANPQHWSFAPPEKPALPAVQDQQWIRQPLDRFVLARLESEGMHPAPEADRYTLARRLSLDLTGLPPTPEEVDAFVRDQRDDAYEIFVDQLLKSPHYGERWARRWLDLARYSDTNGYEKDRPRSIWLYRNWVIDALNDDMPFDQFTIEQIAGDMLPSPTMSQRIATGFHRNTMINEEGGIDPEEDRFKRIVDRIGTTGATWLGLTVGCAQCHSHKYDPISQREFYGLFALFNQADEVDLPVPDDETAARRNELEKQIASIESDYENHFALPTELTWSQARVLEAASNQSVALQPQSDGSILANGSSPDTDVYTLVIDTPVREIQAIQLEAIPDASLPAGGPGRAENGNFVVSELEVVAAPLGKPDQVTPLRLRNARADFSQESYSVDKAIDGDKAGGSGWAIFSPSGPWNVQRAATFDVESPPRSDSGFRLTISIHQQHGRCHLLGRFRLSVGESVVDDRPIDVRRREFLEQRFAKWLADASGRARHWTPLKPMDFRANGASLALLDDSSVLATGDSKKREVFELQFSATQRITALRLEALPHPLLPGGGPGREVIDAPGDFFLSTIAVSAGPRDGAATSPALLNRAFHSFARAGATSSMALDDDEQTAWSISGGTGRTQIGVFEFQKPLDAEEAGRLDVTLTHAMYYPGSLGRFRLSVTADATPTTVEVFPAEIEEALLIQGTDRTSEQQQSLRRYYLSIAPELSAEHARVAALRAQIPPFKKTMVMQERSPSYRRMTHLHRRGEFLEPQARVAAGTPRFLHAWSADAPLDRLGLAHWLVDRRNPLVARVVMNRHWAALFGRGLVRTAEDFGTQGEGPTHPELLDWLATEFMDRGWSQKAMHRMIVTSAVYRQSSKTTPDIMERDPSNRWLARAPRFRVDAEIVRDIALAASGLLNPKLRGPSVFAPQPEGITSSAFGALAWNTERGENRYRRGLYTFSKRTAPYSTFTTFDAPTGDFCSARRERSNTPLQALTLMNDLVFVESSQALARQVRRDIPQGESEQLTLLFRRCLSRPPAEAELQRMREFVGNQRSRFSSGELSPAVIAGGILRSWKFEAGSDDWRAGDGQQLQHADGQICVTGVEKGPSASTSIQAPAGQANLRLRVRATNSGKGRVYWLTRRDPLPVEANSAAFELLQDTWQEPRIEFNAGSDIVGFQFIFGTGPGKVDIDEIEFSYGSLKPVEGDLAELAVLTSLARVLLNLDSTITRE